MKKALFVMVYKCKHRQRIYETENNDHDQKWLVDNAKKWECPECILRRGK